MERDQHFMADRAIVQRMASYARPGETVLEIGPGRGILTEALSRRASVIAIEIDPALSESLRSRLPGVRVMHGNALKLMSRLRYDRIISNIPYAISEPLLFRMCSFPRPALLTVPCSFLSRLISPPGQGRLALYAQAFFTVAKVQDVPREAFDPIPKTRSVLASLDPRPQNIRNSVLSRGNMLLKNALRESLTGVPGLTKNQARERLKALGTIIEKGGVRVRDMQPASLDSAFKLVEARMEAGP